MIYTYPTIIRWGIGSRTDLLFFVCNVDLSEFGECELADRVSYLFGSDDGFPPRVGAVPYGTKELVDSLPLPIAEEFEFIEGPNFEDFPFA